MVIWLFLALRLSLGWRAIASALHLLMMLPAHLLLMMLSIHLLLMMLSIHLLLMIHRMLPMSGAFVLDCFVVRPGLVSLSVVIIAVNIFSLVRVLVVLRRMLVAGLFAVHSCSLGMMFSARVSSCLFTFSCTGSSCGSNALCSFALPVGLIK